MRVYDGYDDDEQTREWEEMDGAMYLKGLIRSCPTVSEIAVVHGEDP
jgi:hypothetical protein